MQNLQVGSTGQAVIDLQKMLIANGANIAADGKFGPLTQAALKNYQGSHGLTPDGIYGPKTAAVLSPAKTTDPAKTTQPAISPQKALISAVNDVATNAAAIGKPPVSFADALALAAKDPNIVSKYADMAKLDKQAFTQTLQNYQTQFSTQAQQLKMQFENDRKNLAENQAAAGTAYSGFRGKAQADLAKTEAGIVTSTRSQQQQQLNNLTSSFESKYGTGATPTTPITYNDPLAGNTSISATPAGGITGSVAPQKAADINNQAVYNYQTTQFPNVT